MADTPAAAPQDIDPGEIVDRADPVITADPAPRPADNDGDDPDIEAAAPPPPNPRNEKLKRIAEKLKKQRENDGGIEATGDFSDPAQNYGQFGKPPKDPDDPGAAPAPAPAPAKTSGPGNGAVSVSDPGKKFRLVVDGDDVEMDLAHVSKLADMSAEEVAADPARAVRYAQKELAANRRLERAKGLLDGARRAPVEQAHQPARAAQQDDPDVDVPGPSASDPNQDPLAQLVSDIQFGADPNEAAQKLRQAVSTLAQQESQHTSIKQKMSDDLVETLQVFDRVKKDNPSLFADPNNEAVMERMLYDEYRQDLRTIGVPEDRIPRSPAELADWHRFYRVKGHKVRRADKLLDDVKGRFVSWRGSDPSAAPQSPERVALDRNARRQAIPSNATRSAVQPAVPSAPTQRKSRKDVLQDMRKGRGQVTAA